MVPGGAGRREGGAGRREGGAGRREGGAGRREGGAGRREGGAGRREGGAGRREGGAGRREGGARAGAGTRTGPARGPPHAVPPLTPPPVHPTVAPRLNRFTEGVTSPVEQRTVRPRIDDVAREAGVSKTAVSFAFNNPERLAPETAARIRRVAERLGYTPHPVARMLTQGETMTIGVLTPQSLSVVFANPFFGAFAIGIATAAEASGYALQFISPLRGSLAGAMHHATVDGVVAVGLSGDHPDVDQIRRAGVPIVLVDSSALPESSSVSVDDVGGARAAAEHLLALGHRDLLVIGVEPPASTAALGADPNGVTARRLAGYQEALGAAGIDLPAERVVLGPATIEGGAAALDRAWQAGLRPTGILAMSDALAIGAIAALRAHGRRIPADVSVVGFDDVEISAHLDPPLTTVHQPIARKGREAVELLLAALDGRASVEARVPIAEHRILETTLVVRSSTGPCPTGRPARSPRADDRRYAGLGPRRDLLPDLPRPVRRRASASTSRAPRAVGQPADRPRLQGRRPARHRRATRLPPGPRDHRALPEPGLRLGREPPISHVRLLRRSIRCSAATTPCASCSTPPTGAGCGSSSMASSTTPDVASGRSITSSRPGHRRRTGAGSTSRTRGSTPAVRCTPIHRRARHVEELGYMAWWGLPALPKLNTDNPEVREFLFSVAEHWLRFGIDGWRLDVPEEIDDVAFWQEFRRRCRAVRSDAYLVGEIWSVVPDWVSGDRFDALMNYPLGEAVLGFAGGSHLDLGIVAGHHEYRLQLRPMDGPAFATRIVELATAFDPDVVVSQLNLLGSHDTPRLRTVLGGDAAAVRLAMLLQATLPGAPCVYYGDEVGLAGANDPAYRGVIPVGRGAAGSRACGTRSGPCSTCVRPSRRCATPAARGRGGGIGGRLRARFGRVAVRGGGQRRRRCGTARAAVRGRRGHGRPPRRRRAAGVRRGRARRPSSMAAPPSSLRARTGTVFRIV